MSSQAAREQELAVNNVARVRLATGPLLGPVLCRVVSMLLARADWPVDRLEDAMLVCDALCAHAPTHASDGRLTFSMRASELEAELRVEELAGEGAAGLVSDALLPGIGNVLERIAERVAVESGRPGTGSQLVVTLSPS